MREMLSGALSAEQEKQLAAHLRDCPKCRRGWMNSPARTPADRCRQATGRRTGAAGGTLGSGHPGTPSQGPVEAGAITEDRQKHGKRRHRPERNPAGLPQPDRLSSGPGAAGPLRDPGGGRHGRHGHRAQGARPVAEPHRGDQGAEAAAGRQRHGQAAVSPEAQAAAAITTITWSTIHAVGEENGLPYIVMEYIVGVSLQERIHAPAR